jgi:hypothetical protein
MSTIKPLAFYLPQFHPTPQNDEWWGPGFTEWTNLAKAKPLFKGHQQPLIPADLGFYDLRLHQTRLDQAALAKKYGVYGFIYYHYWFGNGKMILEQPLNEVIDLGTPDFPICLCWANHSWSKVWTGDEKSVLINQEYFGPEDIAQHMAYLAPIFKDKRYIKVNGAPLFMLFDANIPNLSNFIQQYKQEARKYGIDDIYFVASNVVPDHVDLAGAGFNARVSYAYNKALGNYVSQQGLFEKLSHKLKTLIQPNFPRIIDYQKLSETMVEIDTQVDNYPMVVPNWDNTPRKENLGFILQGATPEQFKINLRKSIAYLEKKKDQLPEQFLILKSWNEWAEGNILEPDTQHGHAYLQALSEVLNEVQ